MHKLKIKMQNQMHITVLANLRRCLLEIFCVKQMVLKNVIRTYWVMQNRSQFILQANCWLEFQEVTDHLLASCFRLFLHAFARYYVDTWSFCLRSQRLICFLSKTESACCQFHVSQLTISDEFSRNTVNFLLEFNEKDNFDNLQGNIKGKYL